ncbi:hypothetical protein TCAL_13034 [Tigriopus californicus]|uniref:Cytochrome P450 n=1 Tax=Tigriopus californicus TaxID=6832 RepID=A0A553P370_TIGCA|nr:cytochrome P450 2L1-like [Tigriopus californicus]TRY72131.1 hypothetical protein TCAL_13034 [Tigriopus californicus]|eukprot:TCALIF_13034-PA protein Name:"Similar to CYP2L1 Cytochrome P450 2L1 (Panulirus argus)" AED:0.03 eAED:0.03 QI:0/-1/0/1/-1/1/1/0/497
MWLFFILVGVFYMYYKRNFIRPPNFPPGPFNYPILGGIPALGSNVLTGMIRLQSQYGKIFSVYMGTDKTVVIADYELAKEALNKDEFCLRPDIKALNDIRYPDEHGQVRGVMFSNGDEWLEVKRFALRHLRDFGFGRIGMEGLILEEVQRCINFLKEDLGKEVCLNMKLNIPILNALWHIISGEKLDYDDKYLLDIVHKVDVMMTTIDVSSVINLFPWLKYIFPQATGYSKTMTAYLGIRKLIEHQYQMHLRTFQYDHMRDFMDVYIQEMKSQDGNAQSFLHGQRGLENLNCLLSDLFVAGSDTTTNTINWTIFYLAKDLPKQRRLQKEIDLVIGQNRLPSLKDKSKLPYLEAIVQEVHRISALGYLGIPRITGKDTKLGGYDIPRGTRIFTHIYHIMHDKDYWTNPDEFFPERFLDKEGKFQMDERSVPFGIGKRQCLGKTLAQNELFLFVAGLFQAFNFDLPKDKPIPKMEPIPGFILACPPYDVIVNTRVKYSV